MHTFFLVGMPSSGKTTLGQALAQHLHLPFQDLDAAIVAQEGRSIPEVFATDGEDYFRQVEAQMLRRVSTAESPRVIATGGGAPLFHNNMDYMKARGVTVFLSVSTSELARRLQASKVEERPLVQALGETSFEEALQDKYKKRLPIYRQAHVQVAGDALSLATLTEALREGGYLRS